LEPPDPNLLGPGDSLPDKKFSIQVASTPDDPPCFEYSNSSSFPHIFTVVAEESALKLQKTVLEDSNSYLQPNTVNVRFVCAGPDTVWSCDIVKLGILKGDKKHVVSVYTVFDLADGVIKGHFVSSSIKSSDVVALLSPLILGAKIKKKHLKDKNDFLVIHSDRGTQFTSAIYTNLSIVDPFVIISHSDSGSPTHNSPVERLFRTTVRNKNTWFKVGYPDIITNFNSIQEAKIAVNALFSWYNSKHINDRSLGNTPEEANISFSLARLNGLKQPDAALELMTPYNRDQEVSTYREQVKAIGTSILKAPTSFEELRIKTAQLESLLMAQQAIKESLHTQETLDEIKKNVEALRALSEKKKVPKRTVIPAPLRDAMTFAFIEQLVEYRIGTKKSVKLTNLRCLIAVVLINGSGIRISDLRPLTFSQTQALADNGSSKILNVKGRRNEIKVLDSVSREYLERILAIYKPILEKLGYPIGPDSPVFTNLELDPNSDLPKQASSQNVFSRAINVFLKSFCRIFNKNNGTDLHITSHSGRIGFITRLFVDEQSLDVIQELAGHKNPNVTIRYSRFVRTTDSKKNVVDRAAKKDIRNSKKKK
jgi:integrase/transposase InsO family protein